MNITLIRRAILTLVIIVSVILINCYTKCTPTDNERSEYLRYRSLTETLNCLYELLPDKLHLEEKCKMYAVILSMTEAGGLLYETILKQLLAMPRDIVDRYHSRMDLKKLSVLYMGAIDKYRTSQLAPTFLDLIGCLKQIKEPIVDKYMGNKHLKVIMYLYQQALESPDKQIDLHDFDLSEFHLAFQVQLESILRSHLKDTNKIFATGQRLSQLKITSSDAQLLMTQDDQRIGWNESGAGPSSSKNPPRRRLKPTFSVIERHRRQRRVQERLLSMMKADRILPAQELTDPTIKAASVQDPLAKKRKGRPPVVDRQELEERQLRRRKLARERDRRRRLENPLQYREERRLRQQRQRLLKPPHSRTYDKQGAKQLEQPERLERQMQLKSQPEQEQRQIDRLQLDRFPAMLQSLDLMSPGMVPIIGATARWAISAPGTFPEEQQRQEQPGMHEWPYHNLHSSQHTFEPSPPALTMQIQPEQMQFRKTQAIVRPTVLIPRQTHAPVVSTQISSPAPSGLTDSIEDQTGTVRGQGIEFQALFAPVRPEQHEAGEHVISADGKGDDPDRLSADLQTILCPPQVGNFLSELNKSDSGYPWYEFESQWRGQ